MLLADIDDLKTELKEFGDDLKTVPEVGDNDSLQYIQRVHNTLTWKYDRRRYDLFGNDIILTLVHAMEWIFDGKSQWDGNLHGAAVTRRRVPGILNLPIRHTHPDTPCSPRGGRRIEDASRRHTAAPLLLG